jgi:hypothetical protein
VSPPPLASVYATKSPCCRGRHHTAVQVACGTGCCNHSWAGEHRTLLCSPTPARTFGRAPGHWVSSSLHFLLVLGSQGPQALAAVSWAISSSDCIRCCEVARSCSAQEYNAKTLMLWAAGSANLPKSNFGEQASSPSPSPRQQFARAATIFCIFPGQRAAPCTAVLPSDAGDLWGGVCSVPDLP